MNLARFPGTGDATLVMGILNVTPDSFSDGGRWACPDEAIDHALRMTGAGAAIVDVGGESTRPGTERVDEAQELHRVIPVVTALAAEGVTVSIDTMRARVAADALDAGAALINDVSGGLADPDMGPLVAAAGVPMVVMHWRGHSADMQRRTDYSMYNPMYNAMHNPMHDAMPNPMHDAPAGDAPDGGVPPVVAGVAVELAARVAALLDAGVTEDQVIIDPGLGFAKTPEHNWQLLAHLDHLTGLGLPLLVGASRKRFLGELVDTVGDAGDVAQIALRDQATAALSLVAGQARVWGVRVHDVPGTVTALRVEAALRAARTHVGAHD